MMQRSALYWIGGPLLLAACATTSTETPDGFMVELPESVLAVAAPYQDLSAVRIDPTSGCYVYRHVGVVETTFLPLRTKDGRPICTRLPDAAPTAPPAASG